MSEARRQEQRGGAVATSTRILKFPVNKNKRTGPSLQKFNPYRVVHSPAGKIRK